MTGPKGPFKIAAADMDAVDYAARYAGKGLLILICDDPAQVVGATIGGTVEVRPVGKVER